MDKIPDPGYRYFFSEMDAHRAASTDRPLRWTRPMVEREIRYVLTAVDPKDGRRKVLCADGEWR